MRLSAAARGAAGTFSLVRWIVALMAVVAGAVLSPPRAGQAAVRNWLDGSANWSIPGNWSGGLVPGAGDTVTIVNADGVSRTVAYDYVGPAITLGSLTIDLTNAIYPARNVLLPAGGVLTTNSLLLGSSGYGRIEQSVGTITIAGGGDLTMGLNAGSIGEYLLTQGTLSVTGNEIIGVSGSASIVQTNGTHTVNGNLVVATNATSNSHFSLTGGTVNAGAIYVGGGSASPGGLGQFNMDGGTVTSTGTIVVYNTAGTVFNLRGGTLTASSLNTSGNPSHFLWTGGTLHLTSYLEISTSVSDFYGPSPFGNSLTISSGMALQADIWEFLYSAGSSITQNGGTNTTPSLYIGNVSGSGAAATYALSSGTLNTSTDYIGHIGSFAAGNASGAATMTQTNGLHNVSTMYVGENGSGTFNQSGGTLLATNYIGIASLAGTGTLNLSGGAFNAPSAYVGGSAGGPGGTGIFNITGGAATLGALLIYNNAVGNAVNFSGGSLTVATINVSGNPSRFHWTGGYLNLTGQDLVLWNNLGAAATIFGNTLTIGPNQTLKLGPGRQERLIDSGSSLTQTGGLNETPFLSMGNQSGIGAAATYTLSGGILTVNNLTQVGVDGAGLFTQTGGEHSTLELRVGRHFVVTDGIPNGIYNLGGGFLTVENELLGYNAAGTMNQTGGTHHVTSSLVVGKDGAGTYSISGGQAMVDGSLIVGNDVVNSIWPGVLTVSAGTLTVADTLVLNHSPGSQITLSGGRINAHAINMNGSTNQFSWTSGTLNILTNVAWDSAAPLTGTGYIFGSQVVLGANKTLIVSGDQQIGGNGPFQLMLNAGGVNTVSGALNIVAGNVTLNGGTLTVGALNVHGTPGGLAWNSGKITINNDVTWDSLEPPTSTSAAFGSSVTLTFNKTLVINGNETIGGAGPFTLFISGTTHTVNGTITLMPGGTLSIDQFGYTLNYQAFNQNGGTITGNYFYVPIGATFTYNSGTFSTQFSNQGTAFFGTTPFSPANGIINQGTLQFSNAQISSNFFDNLGTCNGGAFITVGDFLNSGIINVSGTNFGVQSSGVTQNTGAIYVPAGHYFYCSGADFTNMGIINLTGGTFYESNTLVNDLLGTITGTGSIIAPVINAGLITVDSGTLAVADNFGTPSPVTNNGTISLNGPAARLSSQSPITNNETIEGRGILVAAVVNNGTIEAAGGTLTITGALTNPVAGLLRASPGGKLLAQNFAANVGTISLVGGTVDTGGGALNNTGQISGFGILSTGGLANNGSITFTGGTATINGPVTNSVGKSIVIKNDPAVFTGLVTNNGTIKTTNTTATFAGGLAGAGAFISDPSTNIFGGPVSIGAGGSMTGADGDQFLFNNGSFSNAGTFDNGGLLQSAVHFTNSGSFTQAGPQSWAADTSFTNTGGPATFRTNAGSTAAPNLSLVVNGGTVNLNAAQNLKAVTINNGNVQLTAGATKTGSLAFGGTLNNWTGQLNLAAFAVLLQTAGAGDKAARIPTLQNQVTSGRAGGLWNGTGITSSTIVSTPNTSLALADNADLHLASFRGQPANDNTLILVQAHNGDANLDTRVDAFDLNLLAAHWQQSSGALWSAGDFTGDNKVDAFDLNLLAANWQFGVGGGLEQSFESALAQVSMVPLFVQVPAFSGASVPEPATLAVLLPGILFSLSRPRKQWR